MEKALQTEFTLIKRMAVFLTRFANLPFPFLPLYEAVHKRTIKNLDIT